MQIEPGIAKLALERVVRILAIPRWPTRLDKPSERLVVEAQRLAHFARRRPAAISDDVGGHRRAELSVALINVLNDALALIAAGQIEIDVRPFAAFFGEKALEQQFHADRIDRRYSKRITDGAVGRRAAALHQNVLLAAELDDVPDDQEITCELELLDQR